LPLRHYLFDQVARIVFEGPPPSFNLNKAEILRKPSIVFIAADMIDPLQHFPRFGIEIEFVFDATLIRGIGRYRPGYAIRSTSERSMIWQNHPSEGKPIKQAPNASPGARPALSACL
jgi:hypothetical protein